MKKYSIIFVILTSMMAAGLTACGDTARAETVGDTAVSTTAAYKVVISDDYDPTTDENLKEPCRADFDRIHCSAFSHPAYKPHALRKECI